MTIKEFFLRATLVKAPLTNLNFLCPIKENGLRSTCLSEREDLSKIGTVESSKIGCAIKFSGSLLILFLKIFNSF